MIPRSRTPVVRTGALILSVSVLAGLRLFGAFTSPGGLDGLQTVGTLPPSAQFEAAAAVSAEQAAEVVAGTDHVYHPGRLGEDDSVIPSAAIPFCEGDVVESCYGGEPLRVQAGYIGRDAAEPTIGVDEEGVAFMAASAYDAAVGLPRTRVMRSTDGGVSWSSVEPRLPNSDSPAHPVSLDPYLYLDEETGRVYWMDLHGDCSFLTWSDDQGENWFTNPAACGQPSLTDHPTIVTGNPPPPLQTVGYPNVLYYCFNRVSDASCGRSLDGGITWTPTGAPAFPGYEPGNGYNKFGVPGLCGGLHGHAVVDQAGRLYIPKSHCGLPILAVSEDGGTTWRTTVVSDDFLTGEAHVGEHHSVSIDAAGNVYYLFWDDDEHLPWLAISKDAGRTFGEPMMIAPPGVTEINLPAMVAGDAGKVAISFPATTGEPDDNRRPWDSYVVVTTNALDDDPTFVATTANPAEDPIHRGNCQGRCGLMLDFLDIVTSPKDGGFWAAVVDTCTALNNCNRATSPGAASDGEGVAVRQVGGPRILSIPAG